MIRRVDVLAIGGPAAEEAKQPLGGQVPRLGDASERRAVARPRPIPGRPAQTGSDGVLDDVPRHVPDQVVIVEHGRAVPAMEQVALAVVAAVERLSVEALEALHAAVEIGAGGADEQVEVVPHQAVREA